MTTIETIKKRKSCRTFNKDVINYAIVKILDDYLNINSKTITGEMIQLSIVQKSLEDKKLKLDYGGIKGQTTYLLGTTVSSHYSRINYGYIMEKVVLKAIDLGLSSCWVGTFDKNYFRDIKVEEGHEIPGIVILGFPDYKPTRWDKIIRFSVKASKRNSWENLFFNYNMNTPLTPENVNNYRDSLEMVSLAPSSGNTQPWRIYYDEKTHEFHFFKKIINKKYEESGMHDIDMGIALSHFELTSVQKGLSGKWVIVDKEKIKQPDDLEYIITWKCNEAKA